MLRRLRNFGGRWLAAVILMAALTGSAMAQQSPVKPFDVDQLAARIRALSAGDRSVIVASASTPGAAMMTSAGSANDSLWSEMEAVGWTARDKEKPPADFLRVFVLTESGARAVKAAMAKNQGQ